MWHIGTQYKTNFVVIFFFFFWEMKCLDATLLENYLSREHFLLSNIPPLWWLKLHSVLTSCPWKLINFSFLFLFHNTCLFKTLLRFVLTFIVSEILLYWLIFLYTPQIDLHINWFLFGVSYTPNSGKEHLIRWKIHKNIMPFWCNSYIKKITIFFRRITASIYLFLIVLEFILRIEIYVTEFCLEIQIPLQNPTSEITLVESQDHLHVSTCLEGL